MDLGLNMGLRLSPVSVGVIVGEWESLMIARGHGRWRALSYNYNCKNTRVDRIQILPILLYVLFFTNLFIYNLI